MDEFEYIVCPSCLALNRVPAAKLDAGGRCGSCKAPLFRKKPLTLDAGNFDRHLAKNSRPLIVDFWAPWCGPCKMMAPAFEEAAMRLEPAALLAKLDTEAEPGIAGRFGIRSIPTLVLFKGGIEVARQSGAMSLPGLLEWARRHL